MHENVIFIVLDELTGKIVNKTFRNGVSVMPFLQKISGKSVVATKMYSQAPYTEAAIRGLLYGYDVLDHLENILLQPDFDFTYYKELEKQGYDIYSMTTDLYNGLGGKNYQQNISPNSWAGLYTIRLKYLESYVMQGEIQAYKISFELLSQILNSSIKFYEAMKEDDITTYHFQKFFKCSKEGYQKLINFYSKEYEELLKNKEDYILRFYMEKRWLEFERQEKMTEKQRMQDVALRSYAVERYNKLIRKVRKASLYFNLKNTRIPIRTIERCVRLMGKGRVKEGIREIKLLVVNYVNVLRDAHTRYYKKDSIINRRAVTTELFETFLELLEKREKGKPFFAYFQPNDIHGPADLFPVHAHSIEDVECEFQIAEDFIASLPSDFNGSVNYYTTARIVDERIKNFYVQLEQRGVLENTYFIITSDHGTSYMYDCIRYDMVNNFYDTQYHIPFILHKKGLKPDKIDSFTYSKDIPATLFKLLGLEIPLCFTGHNILDCEYHEEYMIHEYFGGGCPDFFHRPVRFCARNEHYKLVYNVRLGGLFSEGSIQEIHDLQMDPDETYNLVNARYNKDEVNRLLQLLKNRFDEVNEEFKNKWGD